MLVVETIARIRRDHLVRGVPIKKIARDLRVSKNPVRKVVRGDEASFSYERKIQPMPKLGPWVGVSLLRIHEDLAALGYGGGYDAVRRYARTWRRRWRLLSPSQGFASQLQCERFRVTDQLADKVSKWETSALQSRGHSPARAMALVRGRRDRYSGMGGLAQQPAAPGAHRKHPAGRSRGTPLRHAGAVRHGGVTQTKWPPPNPARFRQLKRKDDQYGREFPARL